MQASSSSADDCDMDKDLEELIEVFGCKFSLKDITFAYFQARQDKNLAAETLCSLDGSTSTTITAKMLAAERAAPMKLASWSDNTGVVSLESPSGSFLENAVEGEKRTKELKSKKCSASVGSGSVSCMIGKEYAKSSLLKNEAIEVKKPLKLNSKDFPVSEIWSEQNPSMYTVRNVPAQADLEEFLFKMLGEGFQLDVPVIQEVLGLCGHDVQKSMDRLLDSLVAPFGKCEDLGIAVEDSAGECSDQEYALLQGQLQQLDFAQSDGARLMERTLTGSTETEKNRIGLQKEVLQTLFDFPGRSEEAPKRTRLVRAVKKPKVFSKLVFEPPEDATRQDKHSAAESQAVNREDKAEDNDDSYEVLRTAVKEYWFTMKEYYKAAVDAFVNGDHARANKLLEKGQFFNNKARAADDKSFQKLVETRDADVMSLDLHGLEPKEALRLLRLHLTSISAIKYLRVIIKSNDEDTSKGARKRNLILKQLEKESIKWNDESDGKTILIQVDAIDPKRLSFAKKQEPRD
ncbi:LOW QUALITY PROTEIN: putative nuclear RNA export factor SDE5 [Ricinus communis]|uniref:LOW QUALITY PROTEIN: putative nuclear RNA export factor SDE5 n=1 Tax=Ricinus communis TaxID=3988 RepID=UPI00201A4A12|nr:LOW QUALITY PROTEIN: putative nuclear RNA export factor SDE5 [Ricinus communis]